MKRILFSRWAMPMGRVVGKMASAAVLLAALALAPHGLAASAQELPGSAASVTQQIPIDKTRNRAERPVFFSPDIRKDFPSLRSDFEVMAPASEKYNCIAWSLGIKDKWVWPGANLSDFDLLYGDQGYQRINELDYTVQSGVEKIVLYAQREGITLKCTHAARQEPDGTWTSKLGNMALIRHLTPEAVGGGDYGEPIAVYVRPSDGNTN